ncbi:MAG: hydrogenase nickel incorporation protein HypB [Armatimonadetes bacterium]|nr:hydrogenase nickel incorporation protein HypB [Armatimonadota bacterium]
MRIPLARRVLDENDRSAEALRKRFADAGLLVVNLMGSPGAGKTSLVEETIRRVAGRFRVGVLEGDIATSLDADRISRLGAPVVQINTGGACHLDARMIGKALECLDVSSLDVLLIENVGNLVCPAQFDLGETVRAVVCSLPEGDDKVAKYPGTFSLADSVVLNKLDLAEYLEFDLALFRRTLAEVNADAELIEVSCSTGAGCGKWLEWLESKLSHGQAGDCG